ncbi:hypothetical protein [Natrinema halophilum]|uniref:Uncharacterized protein n=1 Tax=Natrinema halophilum TaxID=1699371 RepID=A0A7D5GGH3_9EURY|nr:hypothetical protein [Natrinema halophilum]QLG48274.1 hypothetical protein HYG82_05130 [Natrinema halophilum]
MLLDAVVVAFGLTQGAYFIVNCGRLSRLVRRSGNQIDDSALARAVD